MMPEELTWLMFKIAVIVSALSLGFLILELTVAPGAINPSIALGIVAVICWSLFLCGLYSDHKKVK
jgi:hypothetical protein